VVSIADIDPRRVAGDLSGTWGNLGDGAGARVDTTGLFMTLSYKELLARPEVQVVDVCVPTPVHHEITCAAVRAGKHVLCEKPLARTAALAKEIADLAAQSSQFCMPAMCMRFWPQWAWLKQAVAEQRYGNVRSAHFTRLSTPPPTWFGDGKMSGGAILDLHVHDTDFVNFLFGMPRSVFSRGYASMTGEIDHVVTQYTFDGVPLVVAEGGWTMASTFGFRMRYTVNFEKATADFDLAREKQLMLYEEKSSQAVECEAVDGWLAELRYFVDCVQHKRKPDLASFRDAERSIRIVEAERRSIQSGRAVEL
jgi:predicted dehydrogenase